jgi:hypothetical protein
MDKPTSAKTLGLTGRRFLDDRFERLFKLEGWFNIDKCCAPDYAGLATFQPWSSFRRITQQFWI